MSSDRLYRHPSLDDRFDPAIRLVQHDPIWLDEAATELLRITDALGDVALGAEHVGSTAVPGLAAKPILDLLVCVDAIDPRGRYVEPLERLGYLFAPTLESPDFHFFAKPPGRPRRYHVHVCEAGSEHEARHVVVRDLLRADADEAERYEMLKRRLVTDHPQDRLAYIEGKSAYMTVLEARALAWARQQPDR